MSNKALNFDYERFAEELTKKIEVYEEQITQICTMTGVNISFMLRMLHPDKYNTKNATVENLIPILKYFNMKLEDFYT